MIQGVNLIPLHRVETRHIQRLVKQWAVGCALWVIVLGLMWSGSYAVLGGESRAIDIEIKAVADEVHRSKELVNELQPQLRRANAIIAATHNVGDEPDWSLLLRLLASLLGEEVFLTSCQLKPAAEPDPDFEEPIDRKMPTSYALYLKGRGRSQTAVSHFALKLEQTALFGSVTLIKTHSPPAKSHEAVDFSIQCQLGELEPRQ